MEVLVGTVAGVFDLEGGRHGADVRVNHLVRRGGDWWATAGPGLIHNGQVVAPPPRDVTLECVAVGSDGQVWVGADRARLYRWEGEDLAEDGAFAVAPGRDRWHTPWGSPPSVRSLSLSADGILYVNVHVGGILRLRGDGFVPTVDISSDVHQVVAHPDRVGVVAAATARGLAVSHDGSDFEFRTEGLGHTYCRAVALEGETVLVSSARGPRGGDARLYRGSLAGKELTACDGLPVFTGNLDTHCVLALPGGYFVGNGPAVWASDDGGTSWEAATDGLPTVTCLA